jgi:hypothetical protein
MFVLLSGRDKNKSSENFPQNGSYRLGAERAQFDGKALMGNECSYKPACPVARNYTGSRDANH